MRELRTQLPNGHAHETNDSGAPAISSACLQRTRAHRPLQQMTKPDHGKAKPVEDYVVTQHGSGPFRAFNFELYAVRAVRVHVAGIRVTESNIVFVQKPTGFMRLAAYAGTTAFVGILGYMVYEKSRLEAITSKERDQP